MGAFVAPGARDAPARDGDLNWRTMEWPLTVARLVDATGEEFLERVEKLDMIFERVSSVEGLSQCDPPTPPCICTHTQSADAPAARAPPCHAAARAARGEARRPIAHLRDACALAAASTCASCASSTRPGWWCRTCRSRAISRG